MTGSRRVAAALLVAGAWLLGASAAFSQGPSLSVELASFSADEPSAAELVVTVLDVDGRPVAGLAEEQFQAVVNGSPAAVTDLTQGEDSNQPIAVVLTMDVSGSLNGPALEQAKQAAHLFLEGLGPEDSVAVVAFADSVQVVQGFTQDREAISSAIDRLQPLGATVLYQATADSVALAAGSEDSRKAVVLLSDGVDNGSVLPREDALMKAEALGVPIFAIGLGTEIEVDYLQELAQRSGGQFATTPSAEGLAALYQEVGEVLRTQYVLTLDTSALTLGGSEAATVRLDLATGGRAYVAERAFCPQPTCLSLKDVALGDSSAGARTIEAEVVSADPVVSVTFLVDGSEKASVTEPPYRFTFDPTALAVGEHTIEAVAATEEGQTVSATTTESVAAGGGNGMLVALVIGGVAVAVVAGLVLVFLLRRPRSRGMELEPLGPRPQGGFPGLAVGGPASRPKEHDGRLGDEREEPPPEAPRVPLGSLRGTGQPFAGETFPVGDAPVSIGSGHRCRIRLDAQTENGEDIAPEEARVWVRDRHLMVHEVRRMTVTGAVGGRWSILAPGDQFSVGPASFVFELSDEAEVGQTSVEETELSGSDEPVPNVLRERPASSREDGSADDGGGPAAGMEGAAREAEERPGTGADAPAPSPWRPLE